MTAPKRILVVTSGALFVRGGHLTIAEETSAALRRAGYLSEVLVTPQNRFGRQASAYASTWMTDVSQTADGQNAFEKARLQALKKIQDNPSGHGYSVLLLKDNPTWLVGEASLDARKVSRELEGLKPSHGNAALGSALALISAMAAARLRSRRRRRRGPSPQKSAPGATPT